MSLPSSSTRIPQLDIEQKDDSTERARQRSLSRRKRLQRLRSVSQQRRKLSLHEESPVLDHTGKHDTQIQPPPAPPSFVSDPTPASPGQKSLTQLLQERIAGSRAPVEDVEKVDGKAYSKYERMKKAGLPEETVRRVMEREGVEIPQDFFVSSDGPSKKEKNANAEQSSRHARSRSVSNSVVEEKAEDEGVEDSGYMSTLGRHRELSTTDQPSAALNRSSNSRLLHRRRRSRGSVKRAQWESGRKQDGAFYGEETSSEEGNATFYRDRRASSLKREVAPDPRYDRQIEFVDQEANYAAEVENPWDAYFAQFLEQIQELKHEMVSLKQSSQHSSKHPSEAEVLTLREQLSKCVSERDIYWKQSQELSQQLFKESEQVQRALATSERLQLRTESLDKVIIDKDKEISRLQETLNALSVSKSDLKAKLDQELKNADLLEGRHQKALRHQTSIVESLEAELVQVRSDNAKVVDTLATIVGGKDNLLRLASKEPILSTEKAGQRQRHKPRKCTTSSSRQHSRSPEEYGRALMKGVDKLKEELMMSREQQEEACRKMDYIRQEMSPKPLQYGRAKRYLSTLRGNHRSTRSETI